MTEAFFYILGSDDPAERLQFACKLTEKAYGLGQRVWLHAADAATAAEIDDLLWSFKPAAFIPHAIAGDAAAESGSAPVLVAHGGTEPPPDMQLLINLADGVPDFFSRFARVAEIVIKTAAVEQLTRAHWRFYRDHGCPLQTHRLQG